MNRIDVLISEMEEKEKYNVGYCLLPEFEKLVKCMVDDMAKSSDWVKKVKLSSNGKNERDSLKFLEEGNVSFEAGDNIKAIEYYTKCLAHANTKDLKASAHSNRSAALYQLKMFNESLVDINAAIEFDFSGKKLFGLEDRRFEIMKALNESLDMKKVLEKNEKTNLGVVAENFGEISIKDSDPLVLENFSMKPRYSENPEIMTVPYGRSKEVPEHSSGIKISFSKEFGRHIVATRDLNPGDIVTVEDPISPVVYMESFFTHCQHCLIRCLNLIPCPECTLALYCSEKCRDSSWEIIHQFECPILDIIVNELNSDEENVRLAMQNLRFLALSTFNGRKIEDLREDMRKAEKNKDDRTTGFSDEGFFDRKSARSFLSLATNITERPMTDLIDYARISALTIMLLSTRTNFFGQVFELEELQESHINPEITFCGAVILRAGLINDLNTFNVKPGDALSEERFGSAIYVSHSFYNHSCAPNTFRYFDGLTLITRAAEPIYSGQQIFTYYVSNYSSMPKDERRAKLKSYYSIDCQCRACINDWPTIQKILKNPDDSSFENEQLVKYLEPYQQRLKKNKYDFEAIKEMLIIVHRDENIETSMKEIWIAKEFLRDYFLDP